MTALTVVIRHGTPDAYQVLACRCPPCETGWTTFLRDRRAARRAAREEMTPDDSRFDVERRLTPTESSR